MDLSTLSTEERALYDAKVAELRAEAEAKARAEALDAAARAAAATAPVGTKLPHAPVSSTAAPERANTSVSVGYRKLEDTVFRGTQSEARELLVEMGVIKGERALNYAPTGNGAHGATIDNRVSQLVIERMAALTPLASNNVVQIVPVPFGISLEVPVEDDELSYSDTPVAINGEVPEGDDPSYRSVQLLVRDYARTSRIPMQLLESGESVVDVLNMLIDRIARAAVKQTERLVLGTHDGSAYAQGVRSTAAALPRIDFTSATTDLEIVNALHDAYFKLKPQYRAGAMWFASSRVAARLNRIRDNGERIVGDQMGQQLSDRPMKTLIGLPFWESDEAGLDVSPTTSELVLINPKYYIMGVKKELEITTNDSAFWSKRQLGVMAVRRWDGKWSGISEAGVVCENFPTTL